MGGIEGSIVAAGSDVTPVPRGRGRPRKNATALVSTTPQTKEDRCRKAVCEATAARVRDLETLVSKLSAEVESRAEHRVRTIEAHNADLRVHRLSGGQCI